MSDDVRAYTPDEIRDHFLELVQSYVQYWLDLPDQSSRQRLEGLVFSVFAILDGVSSFPAVDCRVSPHPDDKRWHQSQGEKWYEPDTLFNAGMLHDEWAKRFRREA